MTAGQIVEVREAMGLSVTQFAEVLGVAHSSVYGWEAGERRVGSRRVRAALQDLYVKHVKPKPLDYGAAKLHVSTRLGVDLDTAARLVTEYGRAPGEPWRDVAERVVDGERWKGLRAAKA